MGKAIQGINPIVCGLTDKPRFEVERLKGEALKVYLQHRLSELEEHIAILYQLCGLKPDSELDNIPYPMSSQQDNWGLLLDLGYLCAIREAIISALGIL